MAQTLLMVHGAFSGGWSFERLVDYFERRGYRCIAPDLRHHVPRGPAGIPPALATTSMRDYLSDLLALVDTLPEPPIVIGHSLGGLLGQMLAARRPLAALVLLAPSPPWGVLPSTALEVMSASALLLSGRYWEEAIVPSYSVAAEYALDRLDPIERRVVFARLVPESGRATFETLSWPQDLMRTTFVFPRDVDCPMLSLVGAGDKVNAPPTVRRIARRYRGRSDYAVLPGMSHWMLTEPAWRELAQTIDTWFQSVLAERVVQPA